MLLQYTLDYEERAALSLPIAANTLRVLDPAGVPIRDLPKLTGIAKEGNAMALGFLTRRACVVTEPDESRGRGQRVRLTPKGAGHRTSTTGWWARRRHGWEEQYGRERIEELRRCLAQVVGDAPLRESLLFEGMQPSPEGWRALVRPPETLPHYPMVLHRGGFPDGS